MHEKLAFVFENIALCSNCNFWGSDAISRALHELYSMVKLVGYSHLWIALGAMCSAMATLHAFTPASDWHGTQWGIASAIGLGTGALYTLQRRIKWVRMPDKIPADRREFIARWTGLVMSGWSLAILVWLFIFWENFPQWFDALLPMWPLLLTLLILALGYASNPFSNHSNGWRDLSRMKLPVIAITWGLATVWIPAVLHGENGWNTRLIARSLAQSLFIAGLTIPFDVRDLNIDPTSMKTIPQRFGNKGALEVALALFALSGGVFFFLGKAEAPLIALACAVPWVIYGRSHRSEWLYSLVLDGCLIVQGFVIFFW